MSEFVDGYEKLAKIGTLCFYFGSARLEARRQILWNGGRYCQKITEIGFGVITGGDPGIMEAGNKGQKKVVENLSDLNIDLPFEQHFNPYIDKSYSMDFDYFL